MNLACLEETALKNAVRTVKTSHVTTDTVTVHMGVLLDGWDLTAQQVIFKLIIKMNP